MILVHANIVGKQRNNFGCEAVNSDKACEISIEKKKKKKKKGCALAR